MNSNYKNRQHPFAKAMIEIEDRIKASALYKESRARVIELSVNELLTLSCVEEFRNAGGRTAVIERNIERVIEENEKLCVSMGSEMIPTTPAEVLRSTLFYDDVRCIEASKRERDNA